MKKYLIPFTFTVAFISLFLIAAFGFIRQPGGQEGYVIEHEKDIAEKQAGPHQGGGETTAFSFFSKVPGEKLAFRKRVLHPGSSIGYHLQKEDEIYYILSGTGEMTINGNSFPVKAGDAILTRPGSSHGLRPTGENDLTLIINYQLK